MCFTIRNACAEDYQNVVRILNQVQKLHVDWRPDIYRDCDCSISPDDFQHIIEENTCFVAETKENIVGVMELVYKHIESSTQRTRDILFIESMAVDETYRGKGIGHLFFEKAKEIKEKRRLDGIELQVNARNRAAYEMYAKYGFTEKSINMELL